MSLKPFWFVQYMEYRHEATVNTLALAIEEAGVDVKVEKYVPFGGMEYDFIPEDRPVIFSGSIGVVKDIKKRYPNKFYPFAWFDDEKLSCTHYYKEWYKYRLQESYAFCTIDALLRFHKDIFYHMYGGWQNTVFIRPDTNDKIFNGELVHWDKFNLWVDTLKCNEVPFDTTCIVTAPQKIESEWRLVIADGKVVTGSQYRNGGYIDRVAGYPEEAKLLAEEAAAVWSPHPVYVMDIAKTDKGYKIVECGSINCAGFYEMEIRPIVHAMVEAAKRDWYGKQA